MGMDGGSRAKLQAYRGAGVYFPPWGASKARAGAAGAPDLPRG